LAKAVKTYLFNSQIVTLPDGGMLFLCPTECREDSGVKRFIEKSILDGENPINEVIYQDLRQSMKNGGGPACLRLRVPLTNEETATLPPRIFLTNESEDFLRAWIESNYPDELTLEDLADYERYQKNKAALTELVNWIGLKQVLER
jgi:succinylarginine dihydrolase